MRISPMELERAPVHRVLEWLYFHNELTSYENYRAESDAWRIQHAQERLN